MALTVASVASRAMELAPDLSQTFAQADYEAEVPAAVAALSRYQPQDLSMDLTGDGTDRLDLTGWDRRASAYRLEYPVDEDEIPATGWAVVRSGAGWSLVLSSALGSGESARLWYTLPHDVATAAGTTTVPDDLREPCALFCSGSILRRMATRYLQQRRSETLSGVELVDLRSQAKEALEQARAYDRQALELLGVVRDDAAGAGGGSGEDVAVEFVTPPWEAIGL